MLCWFIIGLMADISVVKCHTPNPGFDLSTISVRCNRASSTTEYVFSCVNKTTISSVSSPSWQSLGLKLCLWLLAPDEEQSYP